MTLWGQRGSEELFCLRVWCSWVLGRVRRSRRSTGGCREGQQGYGRSQGQKRETSDPVLPMAVLGTLAQTYVDAIQSGAVPCLESAVAALAELRNSAAVREAAVLYRELLEQRAELPTETAEELLELHEQCQKETLQLFAERTITDDVERFREELLVGAPRFGQHRSAAPCSALHPPGELHRAAPSCPP